MPLEIKLINTKRDIARFNKLCGEFHYMGEGRPAGDTLRMAVARDGEWVALLLWGSAAYRLKDRDEFIRWNNAQHCQRDFVRGVVERGGEVLVQVKDNQKTVRANTELKLENVAPLFAKPKKDTDESTRAPSA